jgi:hypothetical protein
VPYSRWIAWFVQQPPLRATVVEDELATWPRHPARGRRGGRPGRALHTARHSRSRFSSAADQLVGRQSARRAAGLWRVRDLRRAISVVHRYPAGHGDRRARWAAYRLADAPLPA